MLGRCFEHRVKFYKREGKKKKENRMWEFTDKEKILHCKDTGRQDERTEYLSK